MTKYVFIPFLLALFALPSSAQNSAIGRWIEDESSLPCYQYNGALPYRSSANDDPVDSLRADPWFLLGNYRLTLFTHVSGVYQIMTGERAWARLNQSRRGYGENGAEIVVRSSGNEKFELIGLNSVAADEKKCSRAFGTGYARYDYTLSDQLTCTRILSVKPSMKVNDGTPAVVEIVRIWNKGQKDMTLSYSEWLLANYCMAQEQAKSEGEKAVTYKNKVVIDRNRALIKADISAQSKDPLLTESAKRASKYDISPPSLYMQVPANSDLSRIDFSTERVGEGKDKLRTTIDMSLKPDEEIEFRIITGYSYEPDPAAILAQCASLKGTSEPASDQKSFNSEALFRNDWKSKLPKLTGETDLGLKQEMIWNAYTLEAMATYSEFYGETFIPQGMTYDYDWGTPGTTRDHLQHSLPLNYFDPQLAKSSLRYALKKMATDGEITYANSGYGLTSNLSWSPSDQQLWLFMAIAEYLRITGDAEFLLEETNYHPMESGYKGTTLDKLVRAFGYLRDDISTGPHGLVRLLNSDWNDMVYADIPVMTYFSTAESHMNSTMALKVLPDLSSVLTRLSGNAKLTKQKDQISRLTASIKLYTDKLHKSFFSDLGEKAFSSRLYFNQENQVGQDDMYLEPQPFLLQLSDFTADRKFALFGQIKELLIQDEILGAREREKAQKGSLKAGIRENGGFWYALNGPLTVSVSAFNKSAAWELLRKMTRVNFTAHFPDLWIGQWSAPDCLNSSLSDEQGHPAPGEMLATAPVFCAHAHAWPLYCYYKLIEQVR
jgi:cellobiose phosphorylase